MELVLINKKEMRKDEIGAWTTCEEYKLGDYAVTVDTCCYGRGCKPYRIIRVAEPYDEDCYLPYISCSWDRSDPERTPVFEIHPKSFRGMNKESFARFLAAQNDAMEAMQVLEKEFF